MIVCGCGVETQSFPDIPTMGGIAHGALSSLEKA
jgi:hypothetical protein